MLFGCILHQDVNPAEFLHGLLDSFLTEAFVARYRRRSTNICALLFPPDAWFRSRLSPLQGTRQKRPRPLLQRQSQLRGQSRCHRQYIGHFLSQFSITAMCFVIGPWPRLHFVFTARSPLLMLRWLKFLFFGHKRIPCVMDLASLLNERRHLHQGRSAILAVAFSRARSLFCCGRT